MMAHHELRNMDCLKSHMNRPNVGLRDRDLLPKYNLQYARISPPVALNRYMLTYPESILSRSVECCEIGAQGQNFITRTRFDSKWHQ